MIKKIKEIKNIWTFSNFSGWWKFEFNKLTFIFWLNTLWKTTLTDIFQSLKDNNSSILTSRKSIPKIDEKQKIELWILKDWKEWKLIYKNNLWWNNDFKNNLEIFWTDFINKNLFTGFSIERENKENFTNFILWKEWVELAELIKDDNKDLNDKKRQLKHNLPKFIQDLTDSEKVIFTKFNISSLDLTDIKDNLIVKEKELKDEKERLKEPKKILWLENINSFNYKEVKILDYLNNINSLLKKDYSDIKKEVLEEINKHIENNFSDTNRAENWIKFWLQKLKNKEKWNCNFCWQDLDKAKDLINAYDLYFDEKYNNFIDYISENLEKSIKNISIDFSESLKLQDFLRKIEKFKVLIKIEDFKKNIEDLEILINKIKEEEINKEKNILLIEIKEKKDEKNKIPYKSINKINFSTFSEKVKKYNENLESIKLLLEKIKVQINDFKEKYKKTENIEKNIKKIELEIKELEYKKSRIENDSLISNINILAKKIKDNKEKLEKNQYKYLNEYFEKINELFIKFWSHNFELEKIDDNRWHKPIYSLKVKFHKKDILDDDLKTVFSESDRRALALAIFWTKIELKTEEEKNKTIVVLDDPVTSFDKERSKNFISYFKEQYNNLLQILIFTHYEFFIRQYYKYNNKKKLNVYKLKKINNWWVITSELDNFDFDYFIKNNYFKYYDDIQDFINYKNSNFEETHLRIFFEDCYLPIFKEQISDEIRKKYKAELNPSHHQVKFEDDETTRKYAKLMMTELYSF